MIKNHTLTPKMRDELVAELEAIAHGIENCEDIYALRDFLKPQWSTSEVVVEPSDQLFKIASFFKLS